MKRLALSICISGSLVALSASAAFGFAANYDFFGQVKGTSSGSVGFFVKHPANGSKRVTGFTVVQVPYTCRDAPPGITEGWEFDRGMRVKARKFGRSGDWTGLPLDPVGKVSGKFRPGGVAAGEFKLRGELAGPGTHCRTGLLRWRATNKPF